MDKKNYRLSTRFKSNVQEENKNDSSEIEGMIKIN